MGMRKEDLKLRNELKWLKHEIVGICEHGCDVMSHINTG